MVNSVETPLDYGGRLRVIGPTDPKALSKVPVGVLEVKFSVGIDYGRMLVQSNQERSVGYRLEDIHCILSFGQIPLAHTFKSAVIDPASGTSLSHVFRISIEDLREIESRRADDLTLLITWEATVIPHMFDPFQPVGLPNRLSLNIPWKLSQKEWVQLLSELGYSERWIVEVERPKLEGFHEVAEHLNKAQEALFNKSDPEDVLRDLRAARDSFKTFYEANREKINSIIDKGSVGEPNKPSKSKRIEKIYESISDFLNIGPHSDKYKVEYPDAQLAFREFISILSYLSSIISEIEREDTKKD